jgi:hypothetical protein
MSQPIRLEDGREVPGVSWTKSDKNAGARITGWNMLNQYLKNAVPDPEARAPREQPGLFIFDRLPHTLEQFPTAPRDEKRPEDLPTRGEYHICDVLRYRILDGGRPMSTGSTVGMH